MTDVLTRSLNHPFRLSLDQYVRASTDSSQNLLNTASLEIEHCHDEYILGLY